MADPVTDPVADPVDPAIDPVDPPADPTDPPADPADPKDPAAARAAYEARQAKKRADELERELAGYKRREEDARKEKMTQAQKLQEERDLLANENAQLKIENLRASVGAELKLPPALTAVLVGSDRESMMAHGEELAKLVSRPRVGNPTDPPRGDGNKRIYKRSELRADVKLASSPEVALAAREGRITDD